MLCIPYHTLMTLSTLRLTHAMSYTSNHLQEADPLRRLSHVTIRGVIMVSFTEPEAACAGHPFMRVSKRGGRVMVMVEVGVRMRVRRMGSRRFLRVARQVHGVRERSRNRIVTSLRVRNEVLCHEVNLVAHPIMIRRGDGVGLPIGLPHRLPFVLEPFISG